MLPRSMRAGCPGSDSPGQPLSDFEHLIAEHKSASAHAATPSLSLENVHVRVLPRPVEPSCRSRILIRLSKRAYPEPGQDPFSPLRLPEYVEIELSKVDIGLLEKLNFTCDIQLAPGVHDLPIGTKGTCQLAVLPDTVLSIAAEVDGPPAGCNSTEEASPTHKESQDPGGPIVRSLHASCSHPIVLRNTANALSYLWDLLSDESMVGLLWASVGGTDDATPLGSKLSKLKRILADSLDQVGEISITQVKAHAEYRHRSSQWELVLSFSGSVRIGKLVPVVFRDVSLPSFVLPIPFASLEELLSPQPLASASLSNNLLDWESFARALISLFRVVEGRFALRARTPDLTAQWAAVDQTEAALNVRLPPRITASGAWDGLGTDQGLQVQCPALAIGFPDPTLVLAVRATVGLRCPAAARRPPRLRMDLHCDLKANSRIPWIELRGATSHPLAHGGQEGSLRLHDIELLTGSGGVLFDGQALTLLPLSCPLTFAGKVDTIEEARLQQAGIRTEVQVEHGVVSGRLSLNSDGVWLLGLEAMGRADARWTRPVPDIPELSIESGEFAVRTKADWSLSMRAEAVFLPINAFSVTITDARIDGELAIADATLHERQIRFPNGTAISAAVPRWSLGASGIDDLAVDVTWDLHGRPCLLHAANRSVSILAEDLRRGQLTAHITSDGRLSFRGERDGLYGIRYFNALLNPMSDPSHIVAILRSEEALSYVFSAVELVSARLADRMNVLRDAVLGVRRIAQRSGIDDLKTFIPRDAMARLMSLVLAGDESCAEALAVQIRSVTEARGLDAKRTKALLRGFFDDLDADYEVAGITKWLQAVLDPMGPFTDRGPERLNPLSSQYGRQLGEIPSAAELHGWLHGAAPPNMPTRLCRLAVMLTEDQLGHILRHADPTWPSKCLQWLRYVRAIKSRIQRIGREYGGAEHAFQGHVIALFLGETLANPADPTILPDDAWVHSVRWPPACAIGPEEVAGLLRAGLALDRQARQTQINNRMLIDLIAHRPGAFVTQALVEIGQDNPNALSGVLFAFLDQDQHHMRAAVDLPALLEGKLGMGVPRRADYMAGGKNAADSYYEALASLAEGILTRGQEYLARKAHLQVHRHTIPTAYHIAQKHHTLAAAARRAIARADAAGAECARQPRGCGYARSRATGLYEEAFERCRELLAMDRCAFQAPWFRRFWGRNEDALRVLSVVRNYQEDVDNVRRWLHVRSAKPRVGDEQDLLETVVGALIYDMRDQRRLLRDPLVRLLVDPKEGKYDFVVVSCMGVITEGDSGTELGETYLRLANRRGVEVLRAPTGTAMSLEENARRIISVLKTVSGPYGYIGYSQGCANALAAESRLLGGTPEERQIVDRLVARNLLYSSFNGSWHGTFGSQKFLQAIIEGERFLKHYQVVFSSEAVGGFLRIVKALLDSSLSIQVLGGVYSLTPTRARDFHREIQVIGHAPTSTTRGVVTPDGLPEALEFAYYLLRHMTGDRAEQDTQVLTSEASGRSTRVINDMTRLLERCDIPTCRQATHHWSPLLRETAFVTTRRDRERAVYDSPKDRHVFPWIEACARFGLIRSVANRSSHSTGQLDA